MAWIPMYLMKPDVEILNDLLNKDDEIAYLVSNGHKEWIAKKQIDINTEIASQNLIREFDSKQINSIEFNLWHIPSGSLPLLNLKKDEQCEDGKVTNPWIGWIELRTGANSSIPYFGAGHPGVINLKIKLPIAEEIYMSSFGWIGNHYKLIGNGADPSTEIFWQKLRKLVKKFSTQIPRGNSEKEKNEIFAFPTAYKEIKKGRGCSYNPF
jgi:hypothetical protein